MSEPHGTGTAKLDVQQNERAEKGGVADTQPGQLAGELDEATERRVRRKLDRVVVLLTFTAYLFAFLDRSNIGNAETAGMGTALGFGDPQYQVRPLRPRQTGCS